jgi:hypothetical protein
MNRSDCERSPLTTREYLMWNKVSPGAVPIDALVRISKRSMLWLEFEFAVQLQACEH